MPRELVFVAALIAAAVSLDAQQQEESWSRLNLRHCAIKAVKLQATQETKRPDYRLTFKVKNDSDRSVDSIAVTVGGPRESFKAHFNEIKLSLAPGESKDVVLPELVHTSLHSGNEIMVQLDAIRSSSGRSEEMVCEMGTITLPSR